MIDYRLRGLGLRKDTRLYQNRDVKNETRERRAIVLLYFRSRFVVGMVSTVVEHLKRNGFAIEVLDVSAFEFPAQVPFRDKVTHFSRSSQSSSVRRVFESLGADYQQLIVGARVDVSVPRDVDKTLIEATKSNLATMLGHNFNKSTGFMGSILYRVLYRRSVQAYSALLTYLRENHSDLIVIHNGRLAAQAGFRAAAEEFRVRDIMFTEESEIPGRFYWRAYMPQNRIRAQAEILSITEGVEAQHREDLMQVWLKERAAPKSRVNPFGSRWKVQASSVESGGLNKGRSFCLAAFTSSSDELAALGEEWHESGWGSQFDAFRAVFSALLAEEPEARLVLRVHPNAINKSVGSILATARGVWGLVRAFPHLEVYWPTSTKNTYELIREAGLVLVHNSTVGVEASAMGIPVIVTQASSYDRVLELRQFLPFDSCRVLEWSERQAQRGAGRWVYGNFILDYEVSNRVITLVENHLTDRPRILVALHSVLAQGTAITLALDAVLAVRRRVAIIIWVGQEVAYKIRGISRPSRSAP